MKRVMYLSVVPRKYQVNTLHELNTMMIMSQLRPNITKLRSYHFTSLEAESKLYTSSS